MNYSSKSFRVFSLLNYLVLGVLSISCIAPLVHLLAVSLSSKAPANANLVGFWPVGLTTAAYTETLNNHYFVRAAVISVTRTIAGPAVSMMVTVMAAYVLSKEKSEFRWRNVYLWFFVFIMLFSGGLLPSYMVIRTVGLLNSIWVLILPSALNVYNLILLLNFYRTSVPKSMVEAAYIDGASHFRTLFSIYLPMALPALATLTLFNIVFHWNSYFDGLIYMTDRNNYPLATLLQTMVVSEINTSSHVDLQQVINISNRTVKAAQIFLNVVPILIIYPFLQRYFIKGITLGSVKE